MVLIKQYEARMTSLLHTNDEKVSIITLNSALDIFAVNKVPGESLEKIVA